MRYTHYKASMRIEFFLEEIEETPTLFTLDVYTDFISDIHEATFATHLLWAWFRRWPQADAVNGDNDAFRRYISQFQQ